jgi:hypothetical protein
MPTPIRINLVSSPRNISTGMMYSFAQRSDTRVVDEPFYAYYLHRTGADHPGKEEIIAAMETDPARIVASLLAFSEKEILFIKNMAHHLIGIEPRFFASVRNVFLIRNPKQLVASFARIIEHPTMTDIGVERQHELYRQTREAGGHPVVIDSGELLRHPGVVLGKLCRALGISFDRNMLSWEAGPRPEDGVWAKYWYGNIHASTSFREQPTSQSPLPDHLVPLYEACLPFYNELLEHSIKADS